MYSQDYCRRRHRLDGGPFIDALGTMKGRSKGGFSSDASTELKSLGITVFDLNSVDRTGSMLTARMRSTAICR